MIESKGSNISQFTSEEEILCNYQPISVLEHSRFGQIKLVHSKEDNNFYVFRPVIKDLIQPNKQILQTRLEQVLLLKKIVHPFLVSIHHVFQTPNNLFF